MMPADAEQKGIGMRLSTKHFGITSCAVGVLALSVCSSAGAAGRRPVGLTETASAGAVLTLAQGPMTINAPVGLPLTFVSSQTVATGVAKESWDVGGNTIGALAPTGSVVSVTYDSDGRMVATLKSPVTSLAVGAAKRGRSIWGRLLQPRSRTTPLVADGSSTSSDATTTSALSANYRKGDIVIAPCISKGTNNDATYGQNCTTVYYIQGSGNGPYYMADAEDAYAYWNEGSYDMGYLEAYSDWDYDEDQTIQERPTDSHSVGSCQNLSFGMNYSGFSFGDSEQVCNGSVGPAPVIVDGHTGGWGAVYSGSGSSIDGVVPNYVERMYYNQSLSEAVVYAGR